MIYLTSVLLGLSSNLHCLGMCGPLVMAVPMDRSSNWSIIWNLVQYHFGRILSYSLLGFLFGIIGLGLHFFGILQWISILFGVAMLFFAWKKWWLQKVEKALMSFGVFKNYNLIFKKTIHSNSAFRLLFLGVLNGFLPCGMVYLALANALLTGTEWGSALAMVFFGFGTLPALFIVGFAANFITPSFRKKMNQLMPYLMSIVAILLILRGLNLGIPLVSPKIEMQQQGTEKVQAISCGHELESNNSSSK